MRRIMYRISHIPGVRLFRNNVGMAIQQDGRRIRYGLFPGSSDLIGWKSVEITPEMVGRKVAVFTAVEVKTPKGRLSAAQKNFIDVVREHGGIAGVARTKAEGIDLIINESFYEDKYEDRQYIRRIKGRAAR